LGRIERRRRALAVDGKPHVPRLVARERQSDRIRRAHRRAPIALRAEALVLARSPIRVSISSLDRSANISPIQSPLVRAIAAKKRRPWAVRLTSCARRSLGEGRRLTKPCSTMRPTRPVTLPLETI